MDVYCKNDFVLDEKCVYDILGNIKSNIIGDIQSSYEKKILEETNKIKEEAENQISQMQEVLNKQNERINYLEEKPVLFDINILYFLLYITNHYKLINKQKIIKFSK
mgnify:CR=1 FL=1